MKKSSTTVRPLSTRTAGFVAGYAVVLTGAALFVLGTDFSARTSEARDSVELAAAGPDLVPVVEAALGATGEGTLSGVIRFDGNPPSLPPAVKKGDTNAKDAAVCAANDVPNEDLVVNAENKGIANVFIFLKEAPKGVKVAKPDSEPIVFDQKNCQFLPHALLVRAGQTVLVKSDDPIPHNTHTNPLRNNPFNQAIAANDRKGAELKYPKGERLPVKVVCDYHNWMKAWHLVLDHPYMAVTDADGKFTLPNVPAGKHEFIIWQEKAGYLNRKYSVEIKSGATKEIELKFGASKFAGFDGPPTKTIAVNVAP